MTTPTPVTPSNAKAWIALIGGLIISSAPMILQLLGQLPAPWGAVATGIGAILAAITGKATHQTPYLPPDTTIVPKVDVTLPPTSGWPQP